MQKSNENFSDFLTADLDRAQYWNYHEKGWSCWTLSSAFLILGGLCVGIPIVRAAVSGYLIAVMLLLAILYGYRGCKYVRLAHGTYHFKTTLRMRKKCTDVHK